MRAELAYIARLDPGWKQDLEGGRIALVGLGALRGCSDQVVLARDFEDACQPFHDRRESTGYLRYTFTMPKELSLVAQGHPIRARMAMYAAVQSALDAAFPGMDTTHASTLARIRSAFSTATYERLLISGRCQRLAYDNLRAAVARILIGAERKLTARFEAMTSHYLCEASFCRPRTGHDKGGVEARGKGIRLQHLVPIPSGSDLEEINRALLSRLDARVDERFAVELGRMLPLPTHAFRARATHLPSVSRRSLITVEGAVYSVPTAWAGLDVTAHVGAEDVQVVGPTGTVVHPRMRLGQRSIDYRHYLSELSRKPQALRQVAAELVRDLGTPFDTAWRLLVDRHGPKQAARIFAKVLGYVEARGLAVVAQTLQAALTREEPLLLALAPPVPPEALLEYPLHGPRTSSLTASEPD